MKQAITPISEDMVERLAQAGGAQCQAARAIAEANRLRAEGAQRIVFALEDGEVLVGAEAPENQAWSA